MLSRMDTTVLSPQAGQTLVATETDRPYWRDRSRHSLDKTILAEQAAYGRASAEQHADIREAIGDAKFDVVAALDDRHMQNMQAQHRSDIATQEGFTDSADRLAASERGITSHIAHGIDVTREAHARTDHAISDVRMEQLEQTQRLYEKIGGFESTSLRLQAEYAGDLKFQMEKRFGDLRLELCEKFCKVETTIKDEAQKSRDQASEIRIRDLEMDKLKLQIKLDLLGKP